MANFSINTTEVLDTVNYIISGPISIGQEVRGIGQSNDVYLTDNTSPYVVPIASGVPSPAPSENIYLKTDCFDSVTIFNPNQKISIGCQFRNDINFDYVGPMEIRWTAAIVRYTGTPDNLLSNGQILASVKNRAEDPAAVTVTGVSVVSDNIVLSLIDQPGLSDATSIDPQTGLYIPTVGIYTYWLQFQVEEYIGTITINDITASNRSIYINLIKS